MAAVQSALAGDRDAAGKGRAPLRVVIAHDRRNADFGACTLHICQRYRQFEAISSYEIVVCVNVDIYAIDL